MQLQVRNYVEVVAPVIWKNIFILLVILKYYKQPKYSYIGQWENCQKYVCFFLKKKKTMVHLHNETNAAVKNNEEDSYWLTAEWFIEYTVKKKSSEEYPYDVTLHMKKSGIKI